MGSSNGEKLSQLYLELVDACRKRFMPQNGKVAVIKCSPTWKKTRKSFKTLSERGGVKGGCVSLGFFQLQKRNN